MIQGHIESCAVELANNYWLLSVEGRQKFLVKRRPINYCARFKRWNQDVYLVGWQLNSVTAFSENMPSCHAKRFEAMASLESIAEKSGLCQVINLCCKICASEIKVNYYF